MKITDKAKEAAKNSKAGKAVGKVSNASKAAYGGFWTVIGKTDRCDKCNAHVKNGYGALLKDEEASSEDITVEYTACWRCWNGDNDKAFKAAVRAKRKTELAQLRHQRARAKAAKKAKR